jgi:hypothetical protein
MASDYEYTFSGKLTEDCKGLTIDFATTVIRLLYPIKEDILEINIKKFRKKRTDRQNRWIWGYAIITVQAFLKETTGSYPSKEALYTFFRVNIVGDEPVVENVHGVDVIVLKGKRFSQCTTVEFSERAEKIIRYYAEMGLELKFEEKSDNLITDFTKYND